VRSRVAESPDVEIGREVIERTPIGPNRLNGLPLTNENQKAVLLEVLRHDQAPELPRLLGVELDSHIGTISRTITARASTISF
jgi:hypothetical protein